MSLIIKPSKYVIVTKEPLDWPGKLYMEWELEKLGEGDRQPSDYELKEPEGKI